MFSVGGMLPLTSSDTCKPVDEDGLTGRWIDKNFNLKCCATFNEFFRISASVTPEKGEIEPYPSCFAFYLF